MREEGSGTLPRRDRRIAEAGLLLLAALSWIYLIGLDEGGWPSLMAMPMRHGWSAGDLLLTYLMWLVMMIAMMTPAVAPTILLIATVERRRGQWRPNRRAGLALLGYFTVWGGACILATLLQYGLHEAGIIYGAMSPLRAQMAGAALILVGIFELTPAKAACLRLCRSPVETVARYWRPEPGGSLQVGLRHGLYCLGCCWALMLILFVTGVMNLLWIAILSALVLAEKLLPQGRLVGRLAGAAILAWGAFLLLRS
jgi:predicted metal-binding membrane protein